VKKYILYLDTKIKGTYEIVLSYFNSGILDKNQVLIIHKLYKENMKWVSLLSNNNIEVLNIKRWKDLPSLEGKLILYMFNAQSNCRMVAYREAKHVFIGHGESNKLSSAKPIFRIYDQIAVSGVGSIQRFLKRNIFTECDIQQNKFLLVGNQFLGKLPFYYDEHADAILYAPTWEGGVVDENFTSIDKSLESFKILVKYAQEHKINKIIVKPHPNTGHRKKEYIKSLYRGIQYMLQKKCEVYIKDYKFSFLERLFINKAKYIEADMNMAIKCAFCDVSAIEMQLLDKEIPYFIFIKDKGLTLETELLKKYYSNIGIVDGKSQFIFNKEEFQHVKDFYITKEKDLFEE